MHSSDDLNHIKEKIQKLEVEISSLSSNINTLKQSVFELTKKVSSLLPEPEEKKHSIGKTAPKTQMPSFNQLQKMFSESQTIENPVTGTEVNRKRNSPLSMPNNNMPNLNRPSTRKLFSVKLNSTNDEPLPNSEPIQTNHESESQQRFLPAASDNHYEQSNELKSFLTDNEVKKTSEELPVETSPKNKELPSLLKFFKKQ